MYELTESKIKLSVVEDIGLEPISQKQSCKDRAGTHAHPPGIEKL